MGALRGVLDEHQTAGGEMLHRGVQHRPASRFGHDIDDGGVDPHNVEGRNKLDERPALGR
jgi:hypothetical protein